MNLSRRALTVIVPVVLLSYGIAAGSAYVALENTIQRLEQNRLDLAATELAERFNQYSTFAESYLIALIENNAFRGLLREHDDLYRQVGLGSAIEKTIRKFAQHQSEKISFLVVDPLKENPELFYFESSNDPFASLSEPLRNAYQQALASNRSSDWHYVRLTQHQPASIVVHERVDRITYDKPLASQMAESALVQLALEPTQYIQLKAELEQSYGAHIAIASAPLPSESKLASARPVGPNLHVNIHVPDQYLNHKLLGARLTMSLIALLMCALSSLLLYRLVRKFITAPIVQLERELSEVMDKKKENIELRNHANDELGRLKRSFHKLYDDLSQAYTQTKELAEHDALTKLYNMGYLNEQTQEALSYAHRVGESLALIYIDLDNFKFVNDKYGHDTGDALLKAFAHRLTRVVRAEDLVCNGKHPVTLHGRIAGDEFSVIVRHVDDHTVPEKIARRILAMFNQGFTFELGRFPVSASIGIAMYPQDGHTVSQLVSNADNAMYQAKNSGKNKIAFYSRELAMQMRRRIEIEQELKAISFDDEFRLEFMALVDARTEQIDGFEVLLRWQSSKFGQIGPDEFVPIAESCGWFEKIDTWVVQESFRAYPRVKAKLGRDFKLSLNLSSAQLNTNTIAPMLIELAAQHAIPPKYIQLEMTETLSVEYTKKADALLSVLRSHGFQIAIDDFGTGYTALLQLVEYPAQMIKFDKTFIDKTMRSEHRKMLEPLIDLCHSHGLQVTAEGVETREVADYLISIGCDYLQGFLYGQPTTLEALMPPITQSSQMGEAQKKSLGH